MDLNSGYYYHLYNRGNNSQKIFYKRENYLFFLKKIKEHLSPFVSIIAWCLMPNHFHFVVFVHKNKIMKQSQTINQSIGTLLSSYTRALQKQEDFSGSLFQKRTKEKCLVDEIKIESSYWDTAFGTQINIAAGKSYLETCVEYVHQNPVSGGLVKRSKDWEYSSVRDYLKIRNGRLIDYGLIQKEGLISLNSHHPDSSQDTTSNVQSDLSSSGDGLPTLSSGDHYLSNSEVNNIAIIGIGSNIKAKINIPKMLKLLETKVDILKVSTFIKTKPIGILNQPDFTNGAVKIQTNLDLKNLNKLLKEIENQLGRVRTGPKSGPRCIDLDIIVWNDEIIDKDYYTRDFLQKSVSELTE